MFVTYPENKLVPTYNDKGPGGEQLPESQWTASPIDAEWNAIVDRPMVKGTRGSAMDLVVGWYRASENLRLGYVDAGPHMCLQGKGREATQIQATRDFGLGQYVIGGGDKLKGTKWHARDIGVVGHNVNTPPINTAPTQTGGIRIPGGESIISSVIASYLHTGFDVSSDHVYADRLKAVNCLVGLDFGLDERQEASHYFEIINLTENRRTGLLVRRSNVAGGAEFHTVHVGMEPICVELEPLLGLADHYEDNPMGVGGVKMYNWMVESPGNVVIYGPTRNVLGNDFGVVDVVGSYGQSHITLQDLDLGIAGVHTAFIVCKEFSGNTFGSPSWLNTPGLGDKPGPLIICDGGSNNALIAPNIGASLKDNKPIFGPADGHRTPFTNYEMGFTDTVKRHTGGLTKASVAVKRNQLMQLAPQGRGVVPHQGTGAKVYGTMGQAGAAGDFLVCWDDRASVAGIPILCDDSSVQGGSPVKPGAGAAAGTVVSCSASDPDRIGDSLRSPVGGVALVVYS